MTAKKAYLCHYSGSKILLKDSAAVNGSGQATFSGNEKLGHGIYCMAVSGEKLFEFLIDGNQYFQIVYDHQSGALSFRQSPENDIFLSYSKEMTRLGRQTDSLQKLLQSNPSRKEELNKLINDVNENISQYRANLIEKQRGSLTSKLVDIMTPPRVPDSIPRTAYSRYDKYYKDHFWDGVDFGDDMMTRTPFFEGMLNTYFEDLVDTDYSKITREIEAMLQPAASNKEMEKFLLTYFINKHVKAEEERDKRVFLWLFHNYLSERSAAWISSDIYAKLKNKFEELKPVMTKTEKRYHGNGKINIDLYIPPVGEGYEKRFDANGAPQLSATYLHGALHGKKYLYFFEEDYFRGSMRGITSSELYYDRGDLISEKEYGLDGKLMLVKTGNLSRHFRFDLEYKKEERDSFTDKTVASFNRQNAMLILKKSIDEINRLKNKSMNEYAVADAEGVVLSTTTNQSKYIVHVKWDSIEYHWVKKQTKVLTFVTNPSYLPRYYLGGDKAPFFEFEGKRYGQKSPSEPKYYGSDINGDIYYLGRLYELVQDILEIRREK